MEKPELAIERKSKRKKERTKTRESVYVCVREREGGVCFFGFFNEGGYNACKKDRILDFKHEQCHP